MAKARRVKPSRTPLYIFLALVLVGIFSYRYYRSSLSPADIFVIQESPVTFGDTMVTGNLRKDAPAGEDGTYLLILPDGRPIILDAQGLDGLVGADVTATGYLSPAADANSSMTMAVSTITVAETQ